jgi:hypothetical protein
VDMESLGMDQRERYWDAVTFLEELEATKKD